MPGFLLKITMAGSLVPSAIHAKTIVKWDRSWLVVPTAIAFTPTQSTVIMTRERKKDGSLVHISYLRQEKREFISFLCDKMLERNSFVFKIAIEFWQSLSFGKWSAGFGAKLKCISGWLNCRTLEKDIIGRSSFTKILIIIRLTFITLRVAGSLNNTSLTLTHFTEVLALSLWNLRLKWSPLRQMSKLGVS